MARTINRLCGCTAFTAWNVGALPSIDVWEIGKYLELSASITEHYNG